MLYVFCYRLTMAIQNSVLKRSRIDAAILDIEKGLNLSNSLKRNALTSQIFFRALESDESLYIRYNSAIMAQTHMLADELLDIADTYEDVPRAKLKSDNIKWLISKRNRKDYGDKLDIDVTHSVDIRAALNEAESRIKDAPLPLIDKTEQDQHED